MNAKKIGFIGLGNLAKAMIGGMLSKEIVRKEDIIGSAKTEHTLDQVNQMYGIMTTSDNQLVAKEADILFLAIKPQFFGGGLPEIRGVLRKGALIVSIAAGKTIADIEGSEEIRMEHLHEAICYRSIDSNFWERRR